MFLRRPTVGGGATQFKMVAARVFTFLFFVTSVSRLLFDGESGAVVRFETGAREVPKKKRKTTLRALWQFFLIFP